MKGIRLLSFGTLAATLLLSGCEKNSYNHGQYPDQWSWPYYQYDENGQPVVKYNSSGEPIYMKPKGSVAPYPFPAESHESEEKIYGVAHSEWEHMTEGQKEIVRESYLTKSAKKNVNKNGSNANKAEGNKEQQAAKVQVKNNNSDNT